MSSSPLTFSDLPTELKCRIMERLDVRSLLRLGLTSKLINEVIYASEALVLDIEMAKSDLRPVMNIRSTPKARRFLEAYVDARLNLPIATRPCVMFPAPRVGIRKERLFRGFFACITDNDRLHVWSIHCPYPTRVVPQMVISQQNLVDVFVEPDYRLLVLLFHNSGDNTAVIKLLNLETWGTRPHPWATSPFITLPGDSIGYHHGQQLLTLRGALLAVVYYTDSSLESRRGIIWNWKTGETIYDSVDYLSSDFHDLLLLQAVDFFLVTVSTFLVNDPGAPSGAWIELRHCSSTTRPATSQLVAEFSLPEFMNPAEHCLGALEFYSSEPPPTWQRHNEEAFPFTSTLFTAVHVLHVWYKPRPEATLQSDSKEVYLIISNMAFFEVLAKWSRRDNPISGTSFPIRKGWDEWAPWWTTMWHYGGLGPLSPTSSVCGSRICTVTQTDDDEIELLVVDFNTKIPCSQWNCTDPLVHFYPHTFGPSNSPWARIVHTWLPYHANYKHLKLQPEGDEQLICTSVLMDEERMVFSTCPDWSDDISLDPTSWKVVHLAREPTALGSNCFMPVLDAQEMEPWQWQHDQICRMCKENPHTDTHILLECSANTAVVDLRRTYLPHIGLRDRGVLSFHDFIKELMFRRDANGISMMTLVTEINKIYNDLPKCSEPVLADDRENSASLFFGTLRRISVGL